jgi:hypothetical protein
MERVVTFGGGACSAASAKLALLTTTILRLS